MQPLKFLTVAAPQRHTATVIFVHGLGDTGYGWEPVAEMFKSELPHVKWILPHAPVQPVTGNGGMRMPSWFDIADFTFDPARKPVEDEKGMLETVDALNKLITAEVDAGIPADHIVLGGFSQGGAMTLLTGLTTERRLAGLAVLSGWTPITSKLKMMVNRHATSLSIFWGHGEADPLVRFVFARRSLEFLKTELRMAPASDSPDELKGIDFHSYTGVGHSTSPHELDDLKNWLKRVIPMAL
ncbi:Phospholipase/carboxylesterase [Vararia minispora EC-137]|uniref:Phospholipase/carboxylesterase n=1 Tax=Vararia minispora EC-137 TaxID=1314806 RepID=A0ACB8QFS1_9AGAM|nr:Phospholipase/carboxylesterase [Vararia minispora EC-137]